MIILAALIICREKVIAIFAKTMITAHSLLDSVPWDNGFWSILLVPNVLLRTPRFTRFSLPLVYLVGAGVVVILYPLGRWFAGVRQRRNEAWLSYF